MKTFNEDWEREALNWSNWARTHEHDAYWEYSPRFFDEIVPSAGRRTLEVGCGEGRVSRDLAARGHRVVGLDGSPTMVRLAQEAHPDGEYVLADAAALPFDDDAFDLVVAYNSLMDIQDMPGAVAEAARVLERGRPFCVCVTHPLADAGAFVERTGDAPFVITGSYLGKRRYEATFERSGMTLTLRGWCYAFEDYSRAFERAGFLIELVREPAQRNDIVAADPAEARWQRLPAFLFLRAATA